MQVPGCCFLPLCMTCTAHQECANDYSVKLQGAGLWPHRLISQKWMCGWGLDYYPQALGYFAENTTDFLKAIRECILNKRTVPEVMFISSDPGSFSNSVNYTISPSCSFPECKIKMCCLSLLMQSGWEDKKKNHVAHTHTRVSCIYIKVVISYFICNYLDLHQMNYIALMFNRKLT